MIPSKVCTTSSLFTGFFNPLNNEIYCRDLGGVSGPCLGSSNGWLVVLENYWKLKLFNPITKSQFQLPPTTNNHQNHVRMAYVHKVVVLPCNDNFVALAIHDVLSNLAFAKLADDKWTTIPTSDVSDCIFFREKIYAVTKLGDLVVFSIHDPTQVVDIKVANVHERRPSSIESTLYLVGQDDELLMVERLFGRKLIQFSGQGRYKTLTFNLYKLNWVENSAMWSKIYSLDGYSIFLGLNTSLCISSKDCPRLKSNQIFYTNDGTELDNRGRFCGNDFGVYNVREGICKNLLGNYGYPSHQYVWPNPIWVVLNPC